MERLRRIAPQWCALALVLLGLPFGGWGRAEAAGAAGTITVIGDSLTVGTSGLANALETAGWIDARVDARVGRHLSSGSTEMSGVLTIRAMRAAGWDTPDWVVALGTNDTGSFGSTSSTQSQIDKIVAEIGTGHRIAFVELAMPTATAPADRFNAVIRTMAAADPSRFAVVSWHDLALGNMSWFASDRIHLNATGYRARTTAVVEGVTRWRTNPPTTTPPSSTPTIDGSRSIGTTPMAVVVSSEADGVVLSDGGRVVDTRTGQGIPGALSPGAATRVDLRALAAVPPGATAVLTNLTTDRSGAAGYLSAGSCASVGSTSVQNYGSSDVVASLAVIPLDPADSSFCVLSSARTHLLVDIVGWLAPGGGQVTATEAGRLADSRAGNRATTHRVTVSAPAGATAALLNVTVTGAGSAGYVTVAPCGTAVTGSTANFAAGETVANLAVAPLTGIGTGEICVEASVAAHVIVDLVGHVGTPPTAPTVSSAAVRVLDTRNALGGWSGRMAAGQTVDVALDLPEGATAVLVQTTAAGTITGGFLTVHDCSAGVPSTSNLNPTSDVDRSNLALVALEGGDLCVTSGVARTDVVLDVVAVMHAA